MRRWTLKLRAQMVFFIICTCIICQCGLINGESKYYFPVSRKLCCVCRATYCFALEAFYLYANYCRTEIRHRKRITVGCDVYSCRLSEMFQQILPRYCISFLNSKHGDSPSSAHA